MRLLTALSGIFLSVTGAFCFAFYTNRFADVAFLVGIVMMLAGLFNVIAYIASGRGENRTTDTSLVEGLVTFFYGFAVLSNQVTDSVLTIFFGTWLTVCGITRFSQSLYVSRFNTKDWSKILPLAIVTSMVGMIMMLPWLVASVMPLMLVGGALLLDGLSVIVYAMYMKRRSSEEMAKGEAEAKARAEAKKAEHVAQRKEQERLRNLSKEDRLREESARRAAEVKQEQERKAKRAAEKQARRDAIRRNDDDTVRLEEKEVEAINAYAQEGEKKTAAIQKPVVISNLRAEQQAERLAEREAAKKKTENSVQINAVKLDEIENNISLVTFEKVELPKMKYASDNESADGARENIIEKIDNTKVEKVQSIKYPTVDLEELVAEPMAKRTSPEDAARFTQKLDFSWIAKLNEEIDKKEENK